MDDFAEADGNLFGWMGGWMDVCIFICEPPVFVGDGTDVGVGRLSAADEVVVQPHPLGTPHARSGEQRGTRAVFCLCVYAPMNQSIKQASNASKARALRHTHEPPISVHVYPNQSNQSVKGTRLEMLSEAAAKEEADGAEVLPVVAQHRLCGGRF